MLTAPTKDRNQKVKANINTTSNFQAWNSEIKKGKVNMVYVRQALHDAISLNLCWEK